MERRGNFWHETGFPLFLNPGIAKGVMTTQSVRGSLADKPHRVLSRVLPLNHRSHERAAQRTNPLLIHIRHSPSLGAKDVYPHMQIVDPNIDN